MLHLKLFTQWATSDIEDAVNDWIREQGTMIAIENQQFSTNAVNDGHGGISTQTEFHVAIWYREL